MTPSTADVDANDLGSLVKRAAEARGTMAAGPSASDMGAAVFFAKRFVKRAAMAAGAVALVLAGPGAARAGLDDLKGTQPGELANGGEFVDVDTCSNCHGGGYSGDKTYLPNDSWAGTMMANAARDPVFFAALAVANQDMPGVGTFCLRCHSPVAFVRGHATPPDGSGFGDEALEGNIDWQGIGCDACHRAEHAPPPDSPYLLGNAQLYYSDDTAKHGPYADSESPAHATAHDPALSSSAFCGQCHQVTNPERKLRDAVTGEETPYDFPLDTTYEEWKNSAFAGDGPDAAGCIDCHMAKKAGKWPVVKQGEPLRDDPRDHAFVGGNHWGIQAVMKANPERAKKYEAAFQLALDRTLALLASAVKVTLVEAPAEAKPGDTVDVTVRVENLTGHKFPTGYAESRRAWVAIALVDGEGGERVLLGGYDDATGTIADEPPTHVYRAVHGKWNGSSAEPEEHLALHDAIVSDTRIPPKGFVASPTTLPTGEIDFGDGRGGYRNDDEATFSVTIPGDAHGAQTLVARVYYQSMTREYVELLAEQNQTDSTGQALAAIYEETGRAPPIAIAAAEAAIDLGPSPAAASSGAGGTGGGAGAGGAGGSASGGGTPASTSAASGGGATSATGSGDGAKGDEAARSGGCGCRAAPSDGARASVAAGLVSTLLAFARRRRHEPRSGRAARRSAAAR